MAKNQSVEPPAVPPSDPKLVMLRKLLEIVNAVDGVEKKGKHGYDGSDEGYDYLRAVDMAKVFRVEMAKRNLLMVSSVESYNRWQNEGGKRRNGVDLYMKFTVYDVETGYELVFHGHGEGVDSGDKSSYKANTGALKYGIRNLFLVPDEKGDPESDPEGSQVDPEYKQQDAAKPQPGPRRVKKDEEQREETRPAKTNGKPNGNGRVINDAQRSRLFAIARAGNPDDDEEGIKARIKTAMKKFDLESTKDIPADGDTYDRICDEVGGSKLKVKSRGEKHE